MTVECAMCGEELREPRGGYAVPPILVEDMQHSDAVDVDDVAWEVAVDLCRGCLERGRRLAMDRRQSPLPECDANRVRYDEADEMNAFAAGAVEQEDLTERMLDDALATARQHTGGEDEETDTPGGASYGADSTVVEAWVIVLSAENLGLVESVPTS